MSTSGCEENQIRGKDSATYDNAKDAQNKREREREREYKAYSLGSYSIEDRRGT